MFFTGADADIGSGRGGIINLTLIRDAAVWRLNTPAAELSRYGHSAAVVITSRYVHKGFARGGSSDLAVGVFTPTTSDAIGCECAYVFVADFKLAEGGRGMTYLTVVAAGAIGDSPTPHVARCCHPTGVELAIVCADVDKVFGRWCCPACVVKTPALHSSGRG